MATPLTWREVTAPDFGTALRGIGLAGNNISQGFNTLGDALGKFQTYRQDQAANQVLNNAAGFTDPTALRSAIADGSLFGGIDRSLVTPQTLAALNLQPGTLLNQGVTQEQLAHAKEVDPLLTQGQSLLNQGRQINNTVDAATASDRIRAAALTNDKTIADIGLTGANTGNVSAQTANLTQNMNNNQTTFDRGSQDYNDQQAAKPFLNKFGTEIVSKDDIQNLLASDEYKALTPGAQQNVQNAAQSYLYGAAPNGSPVGSPATRGIAGAVGGVPQAGSVNASPFTAIPDYKAKPGDPDITNMSIGDVQKHQTDTLIPRTGASSAGGFQINRDTITQYGPKALGADWQKQPFSPQNQDKIARTVFDANKNGNLQAQWSSLPDDRPGAYKDKSWEEMRPLILAGETGGAGGSPSIARPSVSPANQEIFNLKKENISTGVAASRAAQSIQQSVAGSAANNNVSDFSATEGDTSSLGEVVNKIVGTGARDKDGNIITNNSTSLFRNVPPEALFTALQKIMDQAPGATPATAMSMLERAPARANIIDRLLSPLTGDDEKIFPDSSKLGALIKAYNNGTTRTASNTFESAQALAGAISLAQRNHSAALIQVDSALHNPSLSPAQVQAYRDKAKQTRAELADILNKQKEDPSLTLKTNKAAAGIEAGLIPALRDTPQNAPSQALSAATVNKRPDGIDYFGL